jgi:hypothetical protein
MGNPLGRGARVHDQALDPGLTLSRNQAGTNQQVQDHIPEHTVYRGMTTPLHSTQPTLVLRVAPPEAINRIAYGFRRADEHFIVFSSTTVLALASINLNDLESFALPLNLYYILQALRCK